MRNNPPLEQPGPDKTAGSRVISDPRTMVFVVPVIVAACLAAYLWF
jgi:hypothetical protein